MPYLSDLINENKAIENNSNEWKIEINTHVNVVSSNDTGEIRTIFFKGLINSFLNNYQKKR